jgi:hypothetical protein
MILRVKPAKLNFSTLHLLPVIKADELLLFVLLQPLKKQSLANRLPSPAKTKTKTNGYKNQKSTGGQPAASAAYHPAKKI